jgi:uncharacterized protein
LKRAILTALLVLFAASPYYALDLPALKGRVNDYAGMISPETVNQLEATLAAFEQSDSTQVVIVTVPNLDGTPIEDFGIKLGEAWKIGQAKKDNGVIFIVSKDDRKMRIEVGRGLEGVLTDLLTGRILDTVVRPSFKEGKYDEGFTAGTQAIIEACRGEFKNDGKRTGGNSDSPISGFLIFIAIGLYFAIVVVSSFTKIGGGAVGALGLPAIIHFGVIPIGLTGLIISIIGGFAAGLILPHIPIGGGGGRYGGGSSSGGGGGFSGGGGSFGGGGSSGGW